MPLEFDAARIVARTQGREGWPREGKRQLERHRWRHPDPIPRARVERLLLAAERLEAELEVERRANEAYEHYRTTARDRLGRRPGGRAERYRPPQLPAGKVNVTDPDSRSIPIGFGFVQGYNAQAAVSERQIVLAAEITNSSTDFSQLDPMVTATLCELERAGIDQLPEAIAADAGYWNEQHMDEVTANKHIPVLIPPDKGSRGIPRRAGPAGATHGCGPCWPPSTAGGSTENAHRRSTAVRRHQAQQRRLPLPPPRQDRGAHRVAIADADPQPDQAPPPPTRRHRGLKGPDGAISAPHGGHAPNDPRAATARAIGPGI